MLLSLLAACFIHEPTDTADADEPAGISFLNTNNFTFDGLLDIPSFPVGATQDFSLSWADLDKDLQCHDLDPVADIDNVGLMAFPYLTEREVEDGLARDSLRQVDMGVYLSYEPGDATEFWLSQVSFGGTDPNIEPLFTDDSGSWLVVLTTGTGVALGSRMLAFVQPQDGETDHAVAVDDGCAVLDYSVSLTTLTPLAVTADTPLTLEWSQLTVTGQGSPLDTTKVDRVMVAYFQDTDLVALEANFLDLETLATRTWSAPHLAGVRADLAALLADDDQTPFPGFDDTGLWLVALLCGSCPVPAPLALTLVAFGG
ncbi:MAG: hypothetical protein EXR71_11935 [Myxococcales bacterium]|nr:hypothetical protein [Myxococcales bacterium]